MTSWPSLLWFISAVLLKWSVDNILISSLKYLWLSAMTKRFALWWIIISNVLDLYRAQDLGRNIWLCLDLENTDLADWRLIDNNKWISVHSEQESHLVLWNEVDLPSDSELIRNRRQNQPQNVSWTIKTSCGPQIGNFL